MPKDVLMPKNTLESDNIYEVMMNCISYCKFKDLVALLNPNLKIPWAKDHAMKRTIFFVDYGRQFQKLFTVGGHIYYGDRSIIYHTMFLFKDVP